MAHCALGVCFVEESVPESGSTLAGSEGEKNITIFCRVLRGVGGSQMQTEWFIETPSCPELIVDNDPNFVNYVVAGDTLPNSRFNSRTNLTILSLTSDLDNAVISCGLAGSPSIRDANFTLRLYSK